jgi:hypothetical protein
LSAFIAFATSLAVTKPMNFSFFEQETKIAKNSIFSIFSQTSSFLLHLVQKKDNEIISYNVNGIRAAISKSFIEWLQNKSDVICLQEIKTTEIKFC